MGIKAFFKGDLDRLFSATLDEVHAQIIESLCRVGEQAVKLAKLIPPERGFRDHTHNLRASIGYVVFVDRKPVNIYFETQDGKGQTGVTEGQRLALEVGSKTNAPYALIVVAGMNYAVHVESKGRDVLTSAEKFAEKEMAKELADLITNVKNAIKK